MDDGVCHASCYCPGYQEMHSYAEAGAFVVFLPRDGVTHHGVYVPHGKAAEFLSSDHRRTRAVVVVSAAMQMGAKADQ